MNKPTQKDLEYINACIDQELSDEEILAFAERLGEDPSLKDNMAEMMKVKSLLKALPDEKPPRNYILTRRMAGEARKPGLLERLLPTFKTAAVLCSLALIFSFAQPYLSQTPQQESLQSKSVDLSDLALESEEEMPMAAMAGDFEPEEEMSMVSNFDAVEPEPTPTHVRMPQSKIVAPVVEAVSMPSFGVRGGTPKNEYLLTTSRIQPDEKEIDNEAYSDSHTDTTVEETTFFEAPQAEDSISRSDVLKLLLQLALALVLIVSLVWIILANRKRSTLRLQR